MNTTHHDHDDVDRDAPDGGSDEGGQAGDEGGLAGDEGGDHDHGHGADAHGHGNGADAHGHGNGADAHGHGNGADGHDHGNGADGHDHGGDDEHHHEVPFTEQVVAFRRGKDEFFRSADQSPIPHEQRHHYAGLQYFAPDERFRIEGLRLLPDPDPTNTTEIVTSDGKTREAWRVGTLEFDVPGGHAQLAGYAFEPGPVEDLFIPFRDATSGTETYGAGRYLDLELEETARTHSTSISPTTRGVRMRRSIRARCRPARTG